MTSPQNGHWPFYSLVLLINIIAAGLFFGEGDALTTAKHLISKPSYLVAVLASGLGAFSVCLLLGFIAEAIVASIKNRAKGFKGVLLWASMVLWILIASQAGEDATPQVAAPEEQDPSGIVSPRSYINSNGHDSMALGEDGKTVFFTKNVPVSKEEITNLERKVALLRKDQEDVLRSCQFLAGATKAQLIEKHRVELDVALVNYGHSNAVLACSFKLMIGANTESIVVLFEGFEGKMFTVRYSNQELQ